MRKRTKRCPLCSVQLVNRPYLPASKELDHIIPINAGGTHTIGNVRIICRLCNERRPKDGSDYTGPVTLWAQDSEVAASLSLVKQVSAPEPKEPQPPRRRADGERAAELRAEGRPWPDIAKHLGFSQAGNAGACARKYGDPAVIACWPQSLCRGCDEPLPVPTRRGRPPKECSSCRAGLRKRGARAA